MPLFGFYCNHCKHEEDILGKHDELPTYEESDLKCPVCENGYLLRKFSTPAIKTQIRQGDLKIEILSKKVGELANTKQGESLKVRDDGYN